MKSMLYLSLIYIVFLAIFFVYSKIGIHYIRKSESIADVTSEDFIGLYKLLSVLVIAFTIIILILEYLLIR